MKSIIIFFACMAVFLPTGLVAMQAHVLDVGEGQAILLTKEHQGLLIDTGHFGSSAHLFRALERYDIRAVERVILTHLDADHASGIFFVKYLYPKTLVYESGHRMEFDPCYDAYRWVADKLDSGDWQVKTLKQKDRITWRGIEIRVLWPIKLEGNQLNPMSLVLHVTDDNDSWLIMGDVGVAEEQQMLEAGILPKKVNVLVVGHHGANDATSVELLQRTNPEFAVISTDAENIRGYPAESVVRRLLQYGVQVHLVYEQGDFNWPRR